MTQRTLTAMYDSKDAAERAKDQLKSAGVGDVDIHNQDAGTTQSAPHEGKSFLDKLGDFFGGHEDSHTYAEGVRRGHYLLTAKVDDAEADRAVQLLDASGAVDVDAAQTAWRGEGWTGGLSSDKVGPEGYHSAIDTQGATGTRATSDAEGLAATTQAATFGEPASSGPQVQPQTTATAAPSPSLAATAGEGDTLKLVEERLKVGKREVARGGVRVRSYIVEEPVREQVDLREEHVTLERRPVNEKVANPEALLQERSLELTETAEEAVVAKEAVVTEEIGLRKDVSQRTQEINDTVRRTEVEVQDDRTASPTAQPGNPAI